MKIKEWPLIFFTLLIELAAGIFAALQIYQIFTDYHQVEIYRGVSLIVIGLTIAGLAVSLLHLGRPSRAYKAFYGVMNRSPLSWEVITTTLFLLFTTVYAYLLSSQEAIPLWGLCTAILGLVAILLSGRAYMLRSRPAWFSLATPISFLLSSLVLGPLFLGVYLVYSGGTLEGTTLLRYLAIVSVFLIGGLLIEALLTYYHLKKILAGGVEARLTGQEVLSSKIFRWRVTVGLVIPLILGAFLSILVWMENTSAALILIQILLATILFGEFLARAIFYSFSRQMDIGVPV